MRVHRVYTFADLAGFLVEERLALTVSKPARARLWRVELRTIFSPHLVVAATDRDFIGALGKAAAAYESALERKRRKS